MISLEEARSLYKAVSKERALYWRRYDTLLQLESKQWARDNLESVLDIVKEAAALGNSEVRLYDDTLGNLYPRMVAALKHELNGLGFRVGVIKIGSNFHSLRIDWEESDECRLT